MKEIDSKLMSAAHQGLSAMSAVCAAIRDENMAAADQALREIQRIASNLQKDVADKARAQMQTPAPDEGDRG